MQQQGPFGGGFQPPQPQPQPPNLPGSPAGGQNGQVPGPYRQGAVQSSQTDNRIIIAAVLVFITMSTSCFPVGLYGAWLAHKVRKDALARGESKNGNNVVGALVLEIFGWFISGLWGLFWLIELAMFLFTGGLMLAGLLSAL